MIVSRRFQPTVGNRRWAWAGQLRPSFHQVNQASAHASPKNPQKARNPSVFFAFLPRNSWSKSPLMPHPPARHAAPAPPIRVFGRNSCSASSFVDGRPRPTRLGAGSPPPVPHPDPEEQESSHYCERAQRKPRPLSPLDGTIPCRSDARTLFQLLYHSPPRTTRDCPLVGPVGLLAGETL